MGCKKKTDEILTVAKATKLEITRHHFKEREFFCIASEDVFLTFQDVFCPKCILVSIFEC